MTYSTTFPEECKEYANIDTNIRLALIGPHWGIYAHGKCYKCDRERMGQKRENIT